MKVYCGECGERWNDENTLPCPKCHYEICFRCQQTHKEHCTQSVEITKPWYNRILFMFRRDG